MVFVGSAIFAYAHNVMETSVISGNYYFVLCTLYQPVYFR